MTPPMTQRTLAGPVRAQDLGAGLWQLTVGVSPVAHVYIRIPEGGDCAALQDRGISRLDLSWHDDGATVRVTGENGRAVLEAATAVIHEAQGQLYDALPLAGFDARARRFWQRVFLLIRIPGGRYLLRMIARSKRRA